MKLLITKTYESIIIITFFYLKKKSHKLKEVCYNVYCVFVKKFRGEARRRLADEGNAANDGRGLT